MKRKKEFKLSYAATHLSTIVSVTLVLLMLGLISLLGWAAHTETSRLQEQIELSMVMSDTVSDGSAAALARRVEALPYTRTAELISRQRALEEWNLEEDTDLEEVLGVNPFTPEIAVTLHSRYALQDSLQAIAERLNMLPGVEEVVVPDAEMIEAMNENIGTLSVILGVVALILFIITFVLINNTVRVSIYSRRFIIHTMRLVGATDRFIRWPFLRDSMTNGVLAGVIASAIMCGLVVGAEVGGVYLLRRLISWDARLIMSAIMILLGVLICLSASSLATRKYLHSDYDTLYKQ